MQMFKNMTLVILIDLFPNPSFKMETRFANVARTTASTSKYIYQERFQIKPAKGKWGCYLRSKTLQ